MISKLISHRYNETEDLPQGSSKIEVKFFSQPDLRMDVCKGGNDSESDDSEEENGGQHLGTTLKIKQSRKMLIAKNKKLCNVLDRVDEAVKKILSMSSPEKSRHINQEAVDKDDFDCSLCFR